jgi:anaerobic selenocysteine-containing dehydrogenase
LHVHELTELQGTAADQIRVMTLRSEGQFNTVVYEDEDVYRGIDGRDVILLHPEDLRRLQLSDGAQVTVHGPAGSMPGIRATSFDSIKPGNAAMYYPECNVLVSRELDPQSKTPAFKCVVVRLAPANSASLHHEKQPRAGVVAKQGVRL